MTPLLRLQNLLSGLPVDRPPFFPALYDYKAALACVPAHEFAQTEAQMALALRAEAQTLQAEILTSAYDIYNVEAEALGATLLRVSGLPMPEIDDPILFELDQISTLPKLSGTEGRMGLFIDAARTLAAESGQSIPVRGGISGPFSLASKIYPDEQLLIDALIEPEKTDCLLSLCTDIAIRYAEGFLNAGAGVAVFDSFIVPPMLSPETYRKRILPHHQRLFGFLKGKGVAHRALIAGGNTLSILSSLVQSGANQLILDFTIPPEQARDAMTQYPDIIFRYNLRPALFSDGKVEEIKAETEKVLAVLKDRKNLILGTGILPVKTPRANILAARERLIEFYS